MLKKVGIGLGVFFGLFILACLIIPLVVDVDKYRPEIEEAANQNINGKVKIGKLSLSLWGGIDIDVDGLSLEDQKGQKVLSVGEAFFNLPFLPLITGSPHLVFHMKKPEIYAVKDKKGNLNLSQLARSGESAATPTQKSESSSKKEEMELPGIATRATLGLEIEEGVLSYQDLKTGGVNKFENLNVQMIDISLSKTSVVKIWTDIDIVQKAKEPTKVSGRLNLDARITPRVEDSQFAGVKASVQLNGDDIEVSVPGRFQKDSGITLQLEAELEANQREAVIESVLLQFHNAKIKTSGKISNLGSQQPPVIQMDVSSNKIDLASWAKLLPALAELDPKGTLSFNADASGPSDKLRYNSAVHFVDGSVQSKDLKARPQLSAKILVATDQIKSFEMKMKAPGNQLSVTGSLKSFTAPQLVMNIDSTGMDLDQLMKFPPPAPAKKGEPKPKPQGKPADVDQSLSSVRENASLQKMKATVKVDMKTVKMQGSTYDDIRAKFTFKNLVAAVEYFKVKLFDGQINSSLNVDLKPKMPTYTMSAQVSGLDLKKAVTQQMQSFQNTLYGQAHFNMKASGKSFNSDKLLKNLEATGKFSVKEATFASIDVVKMVNESINQGIEGVGDSIPQVKGKKIQKLPNGSSKYKVIQSSFKIKDGTFSAPDFSTEVYPDKGVDLSGETSFGLIDQKMSAKWNVIDTYNMTKAYDIAIDKAGIQVEHLLAEKNKKVRYPVSVGCSSYSPCYKYTEVPKHLTKVAYENIKEATKKAAKKKASSKVKEVFKGFKF